MKKWQTIWLIGILLLLTACNEISGETISVCTDGQIQISIEGEDETIKVWRTHITMLRSEFEERFSQDVYLHDDEIIALFEAYYTQREIDGIFYEVTEINRDYLVIERVYDYTIISPQHLNQLWDVDDFFETVTLSGTLARLEEEGKGCTTETIWEEEETD